jgi:3-hydroxybutyryl-CoA dehydrogenase
MDLGARTTRSPEPAPGNDPGAQRDGVVRMTKPPVIAALGAGRMGRGIAHVFAYAGHEVRLIDIKPRSAAERAALEREALAEIDSTLGTLAALGAFDDAQRPRILQRIRFAGGDEAAAALAESDVVFEGVPEVIDAKRAAFDVACKHVRDDAILASTTSTILVTHLAGLVRGPERFLNAHWLNPAYLVPLVELSPHAATDRAVLAKLKAMLEAIGKVPVVCATAPGFIVPRLQALVMAEAARMVEEGVASAADIDKATRYGFGFRFASIGVVEFIDYGGNDVLYYACRYLARELGERYTAPAVVDRLMQEGRIGLKTKSGFYDYSDVDEGAYRKDVISRTLALLEHHGLLVPPGAALESAGQRAQAAPDSRMPRG